MSTQGTLCSNKTQSLLFLVTTYANLNHFSKFFHQKVLEKTLCIFEINLHLTFTIHSTLPCEIWSRYSEYFTIQQDGVPAHRAWETTDLLKQTMTKLYSAISVATQQSRYKPRLCGVEDCTRPSLPKADQGHGRTTAARWGVKQSWSASD